MAMAGYDEEEQDGMSQDWSWITVVLFYTTYFGIIIGAWEATKIGLRRLLSSIGIEPKKPRMRTMAINTEAAAAAEVAAAVGTRTEAAAAAEVAAAVGTRTSTSGCIYMTTSAGRAGKRYHTRNNCGHIIGRSPQTNENAWAIVSPA